MTIDTDAIAAEVAAQRDREAKERAHDLGLMRTFLRAQNTLPHVTACLDRMVEREAKLTADLHHAMRACDVSARAATAEGARADALAKALTKLERDVGAVVSAIGCECDDEADLDLPVDELCAGHRLDPLLAIAREALAAHGRPVANAVPVPCDARALLTALDALHADASPLTTDAQLATWALDVIERWHTAQGCSSCAAANNARLEALQAESDAVADGNELRSLLSYAIGLIGMMPGDWPPGWRDKIALASALVAGQPQPSATHEAPGYREPSAKELFPDDEFAQQLHDAATYPRRVQALCETLDHASSGDCGWEHAMKRRRELYAEHPEPSATGGEQS